MLHKRTQIAWSLLLLVLVGGALRFTGLDSQPLWLDEIYTLRLATNPASWHGVWLNTSRDLHPPLYYIFLRGILTALPINEFTVRLPSAVAGILAIALLARYLLDISMKIPVVLVSVSFLTFSPFHLYYSQEARSYASSMALLILVALVFRRAVLRAKPSYWILHTVVWTVLVYVHYFNLILLGAELTHMAVLAFRHQVSRSAQIGFLVSLIFICAFFLPLLSPVSEALQINPVVGRTSQSIVFWTSLKTIAGGDFRYNCPLYSSIGAITLLFLFTLGTFQVLRRQLILDLTAVSLSLALLFLILPGMGKTVPPYEERQLLAILPFLAVLVSGGIALLWERPSIWQSLLLLIALIGLGFSSLCGIWRYYTAHPKAHDLDIVHYLRNFAQPGDLVLCNTYSAEATLDIYGRELGLTYWGKPRLVDGEWVFTSQIGFIFGEEIRRDKSLTDLPLGQRVWLIYLPGQGPADLVNLLTQQRMVEQRDQIGPFQVYLLR